MISETAKGQIIKEVFPNISPAESKRLRKLSDEKKLWERLEVQLVNIMGSILRHNETHYEAIVSNVGRERARFFTGSTVSAELARLRGICDNS